MILKRTVRSILVFCPLLLHAIAAQACRMPPPSQLIGVEEQMRLVTDVAVGQVIGATPMGGQEVEYRFLSLETLTGQPGKVFTVMGRAAAPGSKETTFDNHADFAFWARGGGRVMNDADCGMHPSFVIGSSYLVFLGAPATRRSFEEIDLVNGIVNADDKWLSYVKQQLAKRQAADGTQAPERDYERTGQFIYRFHRIVMRNELDRKTLAAQHAPTELLLRVGRLADAFDHIVASNTVPDAERDSVLHEAVAVKKLLAAWSENDGGTTLPAR